jgi:hypothetical protein
VVVPCFGVWHNKASAVVKHFFVFKLNRPKGFALVLLYLRFSGDLESKSDFLRDWHEKDKIGKAESKIGFDIETQSHLDERVRK